MIQTTSIIIDNVLDDISVDKINMALDQSSSKSTWYDLNDNHVYDNFCVSLINLAGKYVDLSSCVGYEFWTRFNTKPPDWHQDKDEKLADEGILKFPLCSIVYYSSVKNLFGGQLLIEDDIITPKTNRMVIFAAGACHCVKDFSGHRVSMLINPWDRHVSVN